MTEYILIYTDFGDTCDGLAKIEGVYNSQVEAYDAMRADVELYLKSNHNNPDMEVTEEGNDYILAGDDRDGRQWQILEK